jgi:phosphotransacetylase
MAHEVTLDIATKFVLHKDVKIEVKTDEGKLGTLLVSKGNVEWLPKGNHVNKKRLTWTKFAELIQTEGKAVKVKKKAVA